MFSSLLHVAIATVIVCSSLVKAAPYKTSDSSNHGSRETRDVVTSNVLPLRRAAGPTRHQREYSGNVKENMKRDNGSYRWGRTALQWEDRGQNLVTTIKVDGQEFTVLVDTASSDTWVAISTVDCISLTKHTTLPQSSCAFGPLYKPTTLTHLIPTSLNITYGATQFVTGTMATAAISIASMSIPSQEIGLVTQASWHGDYLTSGILGLAFPAITNAYQGLDPRTASGRTHAPYNPIFTSLHTSGTIAPYFSLALDRPSSNSAGYSEPAGYLAFGGIPKVSTTGPWVAAPLLESTQSFFNASTVAPELQFYTIKVDAVVYLQPLPNKSNPATVVAGKSTPGALQQLESRDDSADNDDEASDFPALIGSASSFLYLPSAVADELNELFAHPVVKSGGVYTVPCGTTAPTVGIAVSGSIFWIEPLDLLLSLEDGTCVSAIADGGSGVGSRAVLGDPFLKNVLSVFDVGEGEMRFVRR